METRNARVCLGSKLATVLVGWAMATSAAAAPLGTGFTYQGYLEESGTPANGSRSFTFTLYDAAENGNVQGGPIGPLAIDVEEGVFSTELDFGAVPFDGQALWLQVLVNGSTLVPRQPVLATPYALYALDGPGGAGGFWSAEGAHIHNSNAGNVGVGTSSPLDQLHVAGDNATLRLEDLASPGGYTLIEDAQPTQLRISKVNAIPDGDGQVLLDLNPKPVDGTSNAQVRFFRETNTSGAKIVQFLRGNFSTQASAAVGVDGRDSFFQAHGGSVGIRTTAPAATLHVFGGNDASPAGGGFVVVGNPGGANIAIDNNEIMARNNGVGSTLLINREGGDVAISSVANAALTVGNSVVIDAAEAEGNGAQITLRKADGTDTIVLDAEQGTAGGHIALSNGAGVGTVAIASSEGGGANGATLQLRDGAGRLSIELDAEHGEGGEGRVITDVLEITGGSDLAEPFDVRGEQVEPGMVVVIDPERPGELKPCTETYDRKVAGIISGAGGLKAGMIMAQKGMTAGEHPVALSGRVHCWCDVTGGSIQPGDLLTTSATPGHAMKVSDYGRSQGAILGKAMTGLESGRGLVLVLVGLQ